MEMVDRLMKEFWIIFNHTLPRWTRQCPSASSNSASTSRLPSGSDLPTTTPSGREIPGRQQGDRRGDEDPDGDPEKNPGGRGKSPEFLPNTDQIAAPFACPYRKHNPRKYCVADWRSCALGPHKTVARVK
jgi:hypothetical protein